MKKNLFYGLSLLVLAGCASDAPPAPKPPGTATQPSAAPAATPPHKVVFADETGIRFHFDEVRTDVMSLTGLAREHCNKYDKEAQPIGVDAADQGLRQANFACVAGQ